MKTTDEGKIVLVTGSTAIDQTGLYDGSFEEYQSQYRINALNSSFQLIGMKTSFGGCATNIAYGLNLIGVNAIPLSSAGCNFRDRYEAHLLSTGMNIDYITIDESVDHCASCMMLNDQHGNQIIGFYPGPKNPKRHRPSELPFIGDVALAILGPEDPELTLRQAREIADQNIPILFDPGQVITDFNAEQLLEMLQLAGYLIVNDYEFSVLQTNAELAAEEVMNLVPEVVVTHGSKGVGVTSPGETVHVYAVPDVEIVEVTGCGDAFRAGYAFGILEQLSLAARAQMGCVMAMFNLLSPETQKYSVTLDQVLDKRKEVYG
jgi:adenosine kinase